MVRYLSNNFQVLVEPDTVMVVGEAFCFKFDFPNKFSAIVGDKTLCSENGDFNAKASVVSIRRDCVINPPPTRPYESEVICSMLVKKDVEIMMNKEDLTIITNELNLKVIFGISVYYKGPNLSVFMTAVGLDVEPFDAIYKYFIGMHRQEQIWNEQRRQSEVEQERALNQLPEDKWQEEEERQVKLIHEMTTMTAKPDPPKPSSEEMKKIYDQDRIRQFERRYPKKT